MAFPKQTNVRIGRKYELYSLLYVLPGAIDRAGSDRLCDHDQEWQGLRINVKAAKLQKKKAGLYWCFKLHQHHDHCDFFLLCGYVSKLDKTPKRIWMIPADAEEVTGRAYLWVYVNNKKLNQYERQVVNR